jgi:hypothetical protein
MPSKKRNKKRNFFAAWRKCHGDPVKILERIGATMDDYKEWMKDPAFVERFEEAACNEPLLPDDAEGLLLLAKELPIFKWYDPVYGFAKRAAALPEKEHTAFFQRLRDAETTVGRTFNYHGSKVTLMYNPDFRKKIESKVKQCLSGRFKPGFHSEKDKQIAELICDQSLTDRERATKAGMTVGAFKTRKSAWMKNIASLISYDKAPLPRWKRHKK